MYNADERLYLNGQQVDLSVKSELPLTLQINDIANLSNRQTNFTRTITLPFTPRNSSILGFLGTAGSTSSVPYQKISANYYVGNDCLIYEGWAVISQTNQKGYSVNIYDGNIDFFKSIENLTLTDVGLPELNHVKNVANVVGSFDDSKQYKYIIADYNGDNLWSGGTINIDYQIPSARVTYIWDRIFDYAGFTYSGSTFSDDAFTNLYMTFPKPVPTLTPVVVTGTTQSSVITMTTSTIPYGSGTETLSHFNARLLPNTFDTTIANNNAGYIVVEQTGAFRLKCVGSFSNGQLTFPLVNWVCKTPANVIRSNGTVDGSISGNTVIHAELNDKIYITSSAFGNISSDGYYPLAGSMITSFDLVLGYDANFEEALINFKAKDFVDEIMRRFGLTMFKNKYNRHIDFYNLSELLQGTDVNNWSDKFQGKISEKYIYGNYAQRNNFKYRYNDENDTDFDGAIYVNNVNLNDETTIIASNIYAPYEGLGYLSTDKLVYKFWEKEVKDDGTINYKALDGRFYFLRSYDVEQFLTTDIGSEVLNTNQDVDMLPYASFERLSFQEIIYDNYSAIGSVLSNAKLLEVSVYLTPADIQNFDFKKLVYIEQLGSYYLVNKISNFVRYKPTKCELIEVDYLTELTPPEPLEGTYITITDVQQDNCEVTLTFTTDQVLPSWFTISASRNVFGGIPNPVTDIYVDSLELTSNTVTFSLPAAGYWNITIQLGFGGISSDSVFVDNFFTCDPEPEEPALTFITITSIETISVAGGMRNIKVNYLTDWNFGGTMTLNKTESTFGGFGGEDYLFIEPPVEQSIYHTVTDSAFGSDITWHITLSVGSVTSNTVDSV
jgi:hypothetical protein